MNDPLYDATSALIEQINSATESALKDNTGATHLRTLASVIESTLARVDNAGNTAQSKLNAAAFH